MKVYTEYKNRNRSMTKSILILLILITSCSEFVEIDPPRTDLIRSSVFESDATALAAADNMFGELVSTSSFGGGFSRSFTFLGGLSSDELINFRSFDPDYGQFNENTIASSNGKLAALWDDPYSIIYRANAIIEGLSSSTKVTENLKDQLIGEAMFIRAFCFFYLVNLFGDVPLVLTTNYEKNATIGRTLSKEVYEQIVADLIAAQDLLPIDYSTSVSERVRPNNGAATALLARVYLYMEDWSNAEQQASKLIDNTEFYTHEDLNNVFLKESNEAIWQLGKTTNSSERTLFSSRLRYCALFPGFVNSFENGDQRKVMWIDSTGSTVIYFFPIKYQTPSSTPVIKHQIVLRLAEQYLIRAEARAQQNNISGAQNDINVIRNRSGLEDTPANDLLSLLMVIEQERKVELFTEWGHRWLDLKRTGRLDEVVGPLKPNWESYKALYPIPASQILNDPAMANAQNPGYD